MVSVNAEAMKIVEHILESPEALGVQVSHLPNGTTVIDMGQCAPGSWQAGKFFTLVTLAGLAEMSFESFMLDGIRLSAVRLLVDRPIEACVASQISGWRLTAEADAPILSGPARALNGNPDHYFDLIAYRDHYHEGVITIQMGRPVTEAHASEIAVACGLAPQHLYILVTRHACLVSAIQVSARIVEQSLHRLAEEGFDINAVPYAAGYCVIPPLVNDELAAFGRINDALLYGGEATLYVEAPDEEIARVVPKVTSSSSRIYGRPFGEIYEEAGRDFYAIPPELHSPAIIRINNLSTGRTFAAGEFNYEVLRRSFLGESVTTPA